MAIIGGCTQEQFASVLSALHQDAAAATALCNVFATSERTEEVAFGLNTVFMLLSGALVFIMHGGFAMLEAGAIRSKNAMNILLQTVLDGAASAIMWYLVGFGFAYGIGDHPNGFIGDALFALSRYASHESVSGTGNWTNWFYQWAFCATAATIPAGAVAERFNFNAYLGYSLFLGGFVYPVVAHWVWCRTGWLGYGVDSPLLGTGMIDFAGSGVVHMTGGLAGVIGAAMVGPRLGRFDANGEPVPMPGHSAILVVLGTVLLWFGWYGFNPGSVLVADTPNAATVAGRAAVTTTLSGAAGGLTCLALAVMRHLSWDLTSLCNGMLVGFVAVTAGCSVVEPWAALLCGCLAAGLFEAACAVLLKLRVDDVVSAGPMHGVCGAFGVIYVGLLAKEEYVRQTFGNRDAYPYGLFYGGGGKLLASQVIGVLAIGGWVAGTMGPFFAAFHWAKCLRISAEDEAIGLDASKHGGSAYNLPAHGGGGAWAALAGGGGAAAILTSNNNGMHSTVSCSGGGGGGRRSVGDGIMRNHIAGGGGGGGAAGVSNGIVAPFNGLGNIMGSTGASPTGAGAGLYGNGGRTGGGLADLSNGSGHGVGVVRMYPMNPAVRQQSPTSAGGAAAADAGREVSMMNMGLGGGAETGGGGGGGGAAAGGAPIGEPAVNMLLYGVRGGGDGAMASPYQRLQLQQQQSGSRTGGDLTDSASAAAMGSTAVASAAAASPQADVYRGGSRDPESSVRQRIHAASASEPEPPAGPYGGSAGAAAAAAARIAQAAAISGVVPLHMRALLVEGGDGGDRSGR